MLAAFLLATIDCATLEEQLLLLLTLEDIALAVVLVEFRAVLAILIWSWMSWLKFDINTFF